MNNVYSARMIARTLTAVAVWLLVGSFGLAQAPPGPSTARADPIDVRSRLANQDDGNAIRPDTIAFSVADLDRSVAFYRNTFEIELRTQAGQDGRLPPPVKLNKTLSNLTDVQGAKYRSVIMALPGAAFDLKLQEFTGIGRRTAEARYSDPGVVVVILAVRDIKKAIAAAKLSGGRVVTLGGEPTYFPRPSGGGRSVIILRDPDGILIEVMQPDPLPSSAPVSRQVIGAEFQTMVEDTDKTLAFYRGVFGFEINPVAPLPFDVIGNLIDAVGSTFRNSVTRLSDRRLNWFLTEFQNIERKPFRPRIVDPGAISLSLRVRNADVLADRVRAQGGSVVSRTGKVGNKPGNILVREPNGFFIELTQGPAA